MAEGNWVTTERHVQVVNVILAVGLPVCLASYPFAAAEAKVNETVLPLEVISVAVVHVAPSIFNGNADTMWLAVESSANIAGSSPFNLYSARRHRTATFYRP